MIWSTVLNEWPVILAICCGMLPASDNKVTVVNCNKPSSSGCTGPRRYRLFRSAQLSATAPLRAFVAAHVRRGTDRAHPIHSTKWRSSPHNYDQQRR